MATSENFDENIAHLLELVANLPRHSIIVTPEVCLTGFAYERMNEAAEASLYARDQLLKISDDKIITLTYIAKEGEDFVNRTDVIYNGEVVHSQHKIKLFPLGNEHQHFKPGDEKEMQIFEIEGIKFGLIVCFELRFTEFGSNSGEPTSFSIHRCGANLENSIMKSLHAPWRSPINVSSSPPTAPTKIWPAAAPSSIPTAKRSVTITLK